MSNRVKLSTAAAEIARRTIPRRTFLKVGAAATAVGALGLAPRVAWARKKDKKRRITPADRQAAAARLGAVAPVDAAAAPANFIATAAVNAFICATGPTPHYFGAYPNWANSPLPEGEAFIAIDAPPAFSGGTQATASATVNYSWALTGITVTNGGSGYTTPPAVAILGNGSGALATAVLDLGVSKITVDNPGAGYSSAVVTITGDGTGALATATITNGSITAINVATPGTGYTTATITITGNGSGALATPLLAGPVVSISVDAGGAGYYALDAKGDLREGIRKFVDSLPGLGAAGKNNLGSYIPVGVPDTTTYPGSDYYEIELGEYTQQLHSDLKPTTLRGYRQTNSTDPTVTVFSYLGPVLVANRDRPVRIKFTNLLPTGAGGDLFLPVDKTVMGAGMGPLMANVTPGNQMDYTQNRATLHLHGGRTPWISDGTQHQWITPAGDNTDYPKGVSVSNVPDMPDPGPGSQTFYYTNQQSARLLFYHDHAYGITRLNVYAGEAAGYLITDQYESDLIGGTNLGGGNPGRAKVLPDIGIPLVLQDKTFLPKDVQLRLTDPCWPFVIDETLSNLWLPHVYMPNQNPFDMAGVNAMGRWDYGPWIWPPFNMLDNMPKPNPYFDPANPDNPIEPPEIPGVPDVSMGMEAFMDTPLVNGCAYPFLEVEPKAYRFRVLNAANDRFFNLQLHKADDTGFKRGGYGTEVAMVPADNSRAWPAGWPTMDLRDGGIPDPGRRGPQIIQIGTEGGFLPAPVVFDNIPLGWDRDPKSMTVGNVKEHNLFLGPAERADVIIAFSGYAGQTLSLYIDAPAAVPANDPRYDYYSGNPDQTDVGGTPPTQPGYGPNTRTVMQIRVKNTTPAPAYNLAALQAALPATFAASQEPIIVPQGAYSAAYKPLFPNQVFPSGLSAYVRIQNTSMTYTPLGSTALRTITFNPKAIAEEFETHYGRMSGFLGVEVPFTNGMNQTTIFYTIMDPATEIINDSPAGLQTLNPATQKYEDGTQIWKITHNGVDTHPIHFHLFDVQIINRVDWAGVVKPPEPNELGWKETVRMNPLEDCIVALRPVAPKLPFGLPDSVRLLDPTMPEGSTMGFKNVDPQGNPITVVNQPTNFGWEYVWHCHILSHEEMDMMRPIVFKVPTVLPVAPGLSATRNGTTVSLSWTDGTPAGIASTLGNPANEIGFKVMRATYNNNGSLGAYSLMGKALANKTSFTDTVPSATAAYSYQVLAYNAAGESPSNAVRVSPPVSLPATPTNFAAALNGSAIRLTWNDNANNELGYILQRSTNNVNFVTVVQLAANVRSFNDSGVVPGTTYYYALYAFNAGGNSAIVKAGPVTTPSLPLPPGNVRVTAVRNGRTASATLTWGNVPNETGYTIQYSTSATFANNVTTRTVGANTTSFTQNNLTRGVNYYFRVRSINAVGASGWVVATPAPIRMP